VKIKVWFSYIASQAAYAASAALCVTDRADVTGVPRFRHSSFGTRALSVAGPTVWNSLPDSSRDPAVESERFRRDLKTHTFAEY